VSESLKSTLEREWHRTWSRDNDNGSISIWSPKPASQHHPGGSPDRQRVQNWGVVKWAELKVAALPCSERYLLRDAQCWRKAMGCLHPSCNTDQGVKQTRKREDIVNSTSLVLKGWHFCVMVCTQNECPTPTGPHAGWVWVCLFGPERWWTMPEQGEARGNPGGGL